MCGILALIGATDQVYGLFFARWTKYQGQGMFDDELFAVQNLTLELQVGGGGGQGRHTFHQK